jgi:hypothetical protein
VIRHERRAATAPPRATRGVLTALGVGVALCASEAAAQLRPELRADAFAARDLAAHAGTGVERDAGLYARVALVAAVGAARDDGDATGVGARAEATARFLLDPMRQSSRGVYVGGGAGVRRGSRAAARGYLLAVVGVEGARRGGWAPSLEAGFGGGTRVGLVLRRARADRR